MAATVSFGRAKSVIGCHLQSGGVGCVCACAEQQPPQCRDLLGVVGIGCSEQRQLFLNWVSASLGHLPISRLVSCPAPRVLQHRQLLSWKQLRAVREAEFQHPLIRCAMICVGSQDCCRGRCRIWPAADPGWCPSRMRG